ncbi:hypothetical protein KVV02_001089 [Mortierella alpina]|uniref:NADP-dependent oxidoreductase domain-containing protein n=1 Tax=Mortierella alpina TaxID=64518 RepID=A0A9P8AB02_MORAP|nr:hypothetical protein KVV02_001089 [Mortierella alpina]
MISNNETQAATTRGALEGLQSFVVLNNGRQMPLLGLGVYAMEPGLETENAVLCALKAGYRHIDTATSYNNEESVGSAIRKSGIPRDQIFVTTKLTEDDQGYESAIAACELSLRKMGLDYVDLYLIHAPHYGPELRSTSWKALETLVSKGKAKSIGVSNYSVEHLKELLGSNPIIPPVVNQIEIHPWLTRVERVAFMQAQNIVAEAYSPLAQAHKLNDPVLAKIATKYAKSPAQILIRWSLQKGYVVIPKSSNKERIEQNADVFDFDLAEGDIAALDGLNEDYVTEWDPSVAP